MLNWKSIQELQETGYVKQQQHKPQKGSPPKGERFNTNGAIDANTSTKKKTPKHMFKKSNFKLSPPQLIDKSCQLKFNNKVIKLKQQQQQRKTLNNSKSLPVVQETNKKKTIQVKTQI